MGRATTDTLTNKTIDGDDNTIQDLALSTLKTTASLNVFIQRDGSGNVIDSTKAVPAGDVIGTSDTQTLTNKTIDADSNTISNIDNNEIKAAAAIDLNKLAALTVNRATETDGSGFIVASSVTSAELGHLSGVTSALQTQIDGKQDDVITTRGDIVYGNSSNVADRLPIGGSGTVLTSDGTDVSWSTPAGTGDVTAASNIADNALVRGDGGVKGIQQSGITISDTDAISGVLSLSVTNNTGGNWLDVDSTAAISSNLTTTSATANVFYLIDTGNAGSNSEAIYGLDGSDNMFRLVRGNSFDGATTGLNMNNSSEFGLGQDPASGIRLTINGILTTAAGSAGAPTHAFSTDADTGLYLAGANSLGFSTNGTAVGNIGSGGAWQIGPTAGGVTHEVDGIMNFEDGVTFQSGDTLNNYDEGTWTPAFGLETGTGGYTRVGNMVTVWGYIDWASMPSTAAITGLPFTSENVTNQFAVCPVNHSSIDLSAGYTQLLGRIAPNGTTMLLQEQGDNVNNQTINASALGGNGFVAFTISYRI